MASTVETHESEVARGLDLADLLALVHVVHDLKVLHRGSGILLLTRPLQSLGPGLVAQPVADEIGVTGVDQDRDLFQNAGDHAVVWLHPVSVEQEVAVDVEVARVIAFDLSASRLANLALVQEVAYVTHTLVAEIAVVLTLATNIVDILSSALVRANHGIVAVDRSGNAQKGTLSVVASLNHGLAAGQGIVHGLASSLIHDGRVATLTAGHGTVVLILSESIGKTVANHDRLEVDVTLLVRQDLRSEDGNVVASVRLSSNVEFLLRVLGELLEEEGEQRVDVLTSSNRVTDGGATVRVSDVDGLVKENNGSVGVPGVFIVDRLDVLINLAGSQFQEQTGERRATGSTVQPEDNRVILRIVTRFEEPCSSKNILCNFHVLKVLTVEQMLVVLIVI